MRIKIFTPNENGKIELTKEELEALLNESYRQGWNDKPYYGGYWYNNPYNSASTSANTAINSSYDLTDPVMEEIKIKFEEHGE